MPPDARSGTRHRAKRQVKRQGRKADDIVGQTQVHGGAAVATAAVTSTATASRAATKTWKMATSWGGGPLMEIGAKAFADKINYLTEGSLQVQPFPSGTLSKGLEVRETVEKGVAECGHTWMGYDWGKDPTVVLFGGFAGSMDSERMLHWIYEAGGLQMWHDFRMDKFGLVSMPLFIRTAEAFLHSRKPVHTMDDLKGLKLRTAGAWLEISKHLGAAPVTMPGGEVYAASSAVPSTPPNGAPCTRTSRRASTRSPST